MFLTRKKESGLPLKQYLVIIKPMTYYHPVYTSLAPRAQKRWPEINGVNRTYFCGAYWGYGFHEDGVVSALNVCRHFGVGL